MNKKWQLFILIEALLLLWLLYEAFNNVGTLAFIIIGAFILLRSKQVKRNSKQQTYLVIGSFLVFMALLSTSAIWFMLICAILFFTTTGGNLFSKFNSLNFENVPWQEKDIIVVETTESLPKDGKRFKRKWLGNERIGNTVYEWDDINLTVFMGDTIVDIGNTLLPKNESYVVIRKGFGKTRILVPAGIGIMVEHSAFKGKVHFEGEIYALNNESVKLYSQQFNESSRKLKLITTVLIGDLEVISI